MIAELIRDELEELIDHDAGVRLCVRNCATGPGSSGFACRRYSAATSRWSRLAICLRFLLIGRPCHRWSLRALKLGDLSLELGDPRLQSRDLGETRGAAAPGLGGIAASDGAEQL
jgi:hypothetical protein